MMSAVIHIIDLLLWLFMAGSVVYVCIFALASCFHRIGHGQSSPAPRFQLSTFLVLFPAYHEDSVIVHSVKQFLEQDYPASHYHVAVISDHMQPEANTLLATLPITLYTPQFDKSSKAKALQYAISQTATAYDYVVILDADNLVHPTFLYQLNTLCQQGFQAIQCHRTAKNSDNDIAMLDGISEEINNTLFRRAHNAVGLSSALIGSGMCFTYDWFSRHTSLLSTAVEDRELEALLLKENIYIKFADDIYVLDEKVSTADNFQRQRLRWMTGQLQSLLSMLPYIPKALATCNINYIDKTLQQALIPRSILLVLLPVMALLMLLINPVWSCKWWLLWLLLGLAVLKAIPSALRTGVLLGKLTCLPQLVFRMLCNLTHINRHNKDFLHTTHHQ